MCIITARDMIYISWFAKKTDRKVIILYPSPVLGGVWSGCECDTLTWVGARFKPISLRFWITPWRLIEMHLNTCSLAISGRWSTLTRNMLSSLSAKPTYSMGTHSMFTINNITQSCWLKGKYLMGCNQLQDRIDQAIMVQLQSVHLNGHRSAWQLIIYV